MKFKNPNPSLEKLRKQIARRNKVNENAAKRKGRQVTSVEALAFLGLTKRSVFCDNCWGLLPAAVVMNMSASMVHRLIQSGDLYEYNTKASVAMVTMIQSNAPTKRFKI